MGTDEPVNINCPHCSKRLAVAAHYQSATATCPACHKKFPLPERAAAEPSKRRSAKRDYGFINLDETRIPTAVLDMVPSQVARHDKILPVSLQDGTLTVAVSGPGAQAALDRLRFQLNRPIAVAMAAEDALLAAIDRYYQPAAAEAAESVASKAAESGIDFTEMPSPGESAAETADVRPGSAEVVQHVQRMIGEAFRMGAERILILPVKGAVKVAYRVHDCICPRENLPAPLLYPVLVRLMTMTNLTGAVKVSWGGKERKLRVAFKPTPAGLSAIIEIPLDASAADACKAQAAKLGYKFVNLDETSITAALLKLVPEAVARQYKVLPIALEGDLLTLVLHDPRSTDTLDRLRFMLNRPLATTMAPEGAIMAAIDRYYGHADPETADLLLWELAQSQESSGAQPADAGRVFKDLEAAPHCLVRPVLDLLRTFYREPIFPLFESLRASAPLCRTEPESGNLEVVFPQSHLMPGLPPESRQYIEHKVWGLREAILARLENYLEKDRLARGLAMTYAQYLGCCQMAAGQPGSINPAAARDAWVNFLCAFIMQSFPAIDSNGALLSFVMERLAELSARIVSLLDDPALVVDPPQSREWLSRLEHQTAADEDIDRNSPPIVHLLELLIAEAFHLRASRLLLLPREDGVEVAFRVQSALYPRDCLPLRLLYPLLARLAMLANRDGKFSITLGPQKRGLSVKFVPGQYGLAAVLDVTPDREAVQACHERAAKFGCEIVDLEEIEVPPAILSLIPKAVAWKKIALPLSAQGGTLTVVVSDPPSSRKTDELRLAFNAPIAIAMAPADSIRAAIYRQYHPAAEPSAVSPAAAALLAE
jgi:type II secretory ATPase GspE/PulE/Tfp pilus assembly ATPase PilB-like protein